MLLDERGKGYVEGLFAAGGHAGKRGNIGYFGAYSMSTCGPMQTMLTLQKLLGGEIRNRFKAVGTVVVPHGGSPCEWPASKSWEWLVQGDEFIRVIRQLRELELPPHLSHKIEAILEAEDARE